jgi:NAD(P)-dependent dehydrogenase (short-subunit alcohol dehydrogenase family)
MSNPSRPEAVQLTGASPYTPDAGRALPDTNEHTCNLPVALVTGASGGFGLLTVLELAGNGYRVAAGIRSLSGATGLLAHAGKLNLTARIHVVLMDVTDEQAVTDAAADITARWGRIDLLVNNAGFALGGFTEDIPAAEWRRQMDTNFFGLVSVTRAVLPAMRARGCGMIINISSISGRVGFPGFGPYSASKHAVEGFSESLRLELLPFGIRVVLVEPGSYKTAIWQKGFDGLSGPPDSPYRSQLKKVLAYSRRTSDQAADPREVAKLIAAIARKKRPRLRYPIGRGIQLTLWAKALLPWRWFERIIARTLDSGD